MAQSAFFRRVGFKGSLVLGIAAPVVLLLGGCDTDTGKADKAISAQLDDAAAHMTGSAADLENANRMLGSAAADTTISAPVQIRAKSLLGDSELRIAQGLVKKINANDGQIDRLVREIGLLGNQIQANSQMVAGLAKYDPAPLQDAVTQKKNDVNGSDTKPEWYKSDAGTLGSLAAVDSQIKDLQGKVSASQATIKSDSDQRNQLLAQADKSTQDSQHEQGQKSVDLYTQGSNARKQAADLTVKIDNDTATLAAQQADLGVAQGQHDSLTAALKSLDDKSSTFATDWQGVQAEQAALNEGSKKILGDDPVNVPAADGNGDLKTDETIGAKAAAIVALAKKNHELRGQAETRFNNAIAKYREAVDAAGKVYTDLSDRAQKVDPANPNRAPWKQEQEALDASTYRFLQATAQAQQAEFYARSAAEAKVRLDMIERIKPVIAEAKLMQYPSLDDADGSVTDQLKKAQASARDAFKNSSDLLGKIFDGGPALPELKTGAQVAEIFAQYGWSSLEAAAGDAQEAANHLNFARNALAASISDGATLPPLPKELATAPTPAGGSATPPR